MMLVPAIMSGGAGSRLWPVSRQKHPKPFVKLSDNKSLLQHAFLRGTALAPGNPVITVTNQELFFKTEDEYRAVNTMNAPCFYLLEPEGRNTAAATAAVAHFAAENFGKDTVVVLFPADHMIQDVDTFLFAAQQAVDLAEEGKLITFGITPTYPETGYGYIEADGNRVLGFMEKPELATAQQYLEKGNYYWNSGIFCFKADTMIDLQRRYCPNILETVQKSLLLGHRSPVVSGEQITLDSDTFLQTPNNSIDYAVLEKAENIAVVPCDIGWSDIGSWNAMSDLVEPDEEGNRVVGDAILISSRNCYVHQSRHLISALGVEDLLIIDSEDAFLIAHKDFAQDVRHVFTYLQERNHPAYSSHPTVYRPWGKYTVLDEGERFKIRCVEVKPGARLGLHKHMHRSEHWVVVKGIAKVVNGGENMILTANQSTYIPQGQKHRLENEGKSPLILIEIQSGEYLSEEDISSYRDL